MNASLIISIYRLHKELPLLLSALSQQSLIPSEIIFAEDDTSSETVRILESLSHRYPHLRLKLIQHEDIGFRKGTIINKAVAITEFDKLIFLDGDCLPHKNYVKSYVDILQVDMLLNARPVYLSNDAREIFLDFNDTFRQPGIAQVLCRAFSGRRYSVYFPQMPVLKRKSAMRGSSWACMKKDYLRVNGFDERFCEAGYGYEDIDMSHRLNRAGVDCYVPKYRVIYYHFGPAGFGAEKAQALAKTRDILDANDEAKLIACQFGVDQWIGNVAPTWASDC
jgi:predicted glycosyltransferase involved in capsule biosynthesis